MKKHIWGVIFSITFTSFENNETLAQNINWLQHIGGPGAELAYDGVCDKNGNYYLPGSFQGKCFFPSETLWCKGYNDTFLTKFNSNGEEEWVLKFGGDNPGGDYPIYEGLIVHYDSISNFLYLAGIYYGWVTFGNYFFDAKDDIILAKYTTDGHCVWAKQFGGEGSDGCYAITTDKTGNTYMCGCTNYYLGFGSDTVSKGGFMAKFDSAGNCIWAKNKFAYDPISTSVITMTGIAVTDSAILISGNMAKDCVVNIDTVTINHLGYGSCLIIFLDPDGNATLVKEGISRITGTSSSLSLSADDGILFTGYFKDTIYFDTSYLSTVTGNQEMFLVKYDKNGVFQWARKAGASMAEGSRVFSDSQGYSYVAGIFSGSAAFGGQNLTSFSGKDAFVARYDPAGQCLGVMHWGNCAASGITEDPEQNPMVVILYTGSCTIGDSIYPSFGESDIIVLKSGPITSTKESPAGPSNRLLIYANPTTGKCNITIPDEFRHEKELTLYIYDSQGRLVQQAAIKEAEGTYRLDIRAQAAGIYQAVLSNGTKRYSGKIVFAKGE